MEIIYSASGGFSDTVQRLLALKNPDPTWYYAAVCRKGEERLDLRIDPGLRE